MWRGRLKAEEVQKFAGVCERTARSLLAEWRFSGLLPTYRPNAERCLLAAHDFEPDPSVTNPAIVFPLLLIADRLPGNPFSMCAPVYGGHDLSCTAPRSSEPTRQIIGACLDQEVVNLIYATKSGQQEFHFSPSALVHARGRYHLRGHRANGRDAHGIRLDDRYVDVVPSRAIEAWRIKNAPFVGLEHDDDWHLIEECEFVLSSELSKQERLCYEHEYDIAETGRLKFQERSALIPYVIQELSERRCWRRDGSAVRVWAVGTYGSEHFRRR